MHLTRRPLATALASVALASGVVGLGPASGPALGSSPPPTLTPIKHVVVIFQENVSFDHYFGTYPVAANTDGQTFTAEPGTPTVNGLDHNLLTNNPNLSNPARLSSAQALTCDEDHEYTDEQKAADGGLMDKFVQFTGTGTGKDPSGQPCMAGQVMDYYDGNTTTALWNYAQRYGMSDNSYGTSYGPSTVGALNLVSGQTHGVIATATPGTSSLTGEIENGTVMGDPQPLGDDCSSRDQVQMSGKNVGDLLNSKGVTWGFFEGGFAPTVPYNATTGAAAICGAKHNVGAGIGGTGQFGTKADYIPHHEPFQYYASTANPHHLPPTSTAMIGQTDQANHQYDLTNFWAAADSDHLPAVSYLKAAGYQDGHAGYSDPLDEQQFLVNTINHLQTLPDWSSTAVVISYDDSDGWYDHAFLPPVNGSTAPADALNGPGRCGTAAATANLQDRCGYGPRLPLLVISPYSRTNFVDHQVTDQSSILSFVERNWHLGRIGQGSFDEIANPLMEFFDFAQPHADTLSLNPDTGRQQD